MAILFTTFSCTVPQNDNVSQNNPSNPPSSPSPRDGATDLPRYNVILFWECFDPDFDPLTFDVYFGTDPTSTNLATTTTQKSFNPGTLNLGTTYYWKIVARDDKGAETPGPVWRFTTTSCPLCQ
ncbi:MAG: hypothetical protein ABDH53_09270 [Pseudothermotoga sp.]